MNSQDLKKVIYTLCGGVIIAILVFIAIPSKKSPDIKDAYFVYDDDNLTVVKEDADLSDKERESITAVQEKAGTTNLKIEEVETFSTFNVKDDISNDLEEAVPLVQGYVVKIDDNKYYLSDKEIYQRCIDDLVAKAFPDNSTYQEYQRTNEIRKVNVGDKTFTGFEIQNKISVTEALVPQDKVINSEEEFRFLINNNNKSKELVTVKEGQTINQILEEYGLTKEEFAINNEISTTSLISEGMQLVVNKPDPIIEVVSFYEYTQEEDLPYQTSKESSDSLKVGETKVKQSGENGRQKVTYQVKMVNGKEISNQVIGYDIVKESTPEIILVGTYEPPGVGSGNLRWPASSCRITNGYGGLDLAGVGHYAIDIQSWYGAPVYSADGGRVIMAGWDPYGGGHSVRIDHGNGIVTQYNHLMSAPPVSVGQNVEAGQIIGYEGASGLVTGPHLHFEVRVNGVRQNPLNYVSC